MFVVVPVPVSVGFAVVVGSVVVAAGGVVAASLVCQRGANEEHRDRRGEEEGGRRRVPRERGVAAHHQPETDQISERSRAASAPAAERQSSFPAR